MNILLALLGITLIAACEQTNCESLYSGKFYYYTVDSVRIDLNRYSTYQAEFNHSTQQLNIYDLFWIDECSYQLCPHQNHEILDLDCVSMQVESVSPDFHVVRSIEDGRFTQVIYRMEE